MGQNRVWYKTMAREQANAAESKDWTDAFVSMWFAFAFDDGWRRILNGDAAYRYTKLELAANTDGDVAISAVNAAITPSRMYRVLDRKVVRDKRLATITETVLEPTVAGNYLRFGPTAGSTTVTLWVNHIPENPESFTTNPNTTIVDWPAGFELVPVNHLAALLLTKGAIQSADAAQLFAVTDQLYTSMIQTLMDRTTNHQQIIPSDSAGEWGPGPVY